MKKILGYILVGLGMLIAWPIRIGLPLFALGYIIFTFLNQGILAGVLSILIAGIAVWLIEFAIGFVMLPLAALASALLEKK
jgi:hypothetical protein